MWRWGPAHIIGWRGSPRRQPGRGISFQQAVPLTRTKREQQQQRQQNLPQYPSLMTQPMCNELIGWLAGSSDERSPRFFFSPPPFHPHSAGEGSRGEEAEEQRHYPLTARSCRVPRFSGRKWATELMGADLSRQGCFVLTEGTRHQFFCLNVLFIFG